MTDPNATIATPQAPDRPAATGGTREALELLSSMRFAISLLAVICIASVIGTVVKQNEPINNSAQYGPNWLT